MRRAIREQLKSNATKTHERAIARQFERLKVQHLAEQRFIAWKAEQGKSAAPKPTQPAGPTSIAREVAYGRVVMPLMPLAEAGAREAALERRRALRERKLNNTDIITAPEAAREMREFEAEERARYTHAARLLNSGMSETNVCLKLDLEESDLENIKAQLEGRA